MNARAVVGVALALVVGALGACTSSGSAAPSGSPGVSTGPSSPTAVVTASGSPTDGVRYYAQLASAAPDPSASPLASGDGAVDGMAYHVAVLSVQAWTDATVVTFVMAGPVDTDHQLAGQTGLAGHSAFHGIQSLSIVEPSGTTLSPAIYDPVEPTSPPEGGSDTSARAPAVRPAGTLLTALTGPLTAGTATVTLRMAGLTDITGIPVTWEKH